MTIDNYDSRTGAWTLEDDGAETLRAPMTAALNACENEETSPATVRSVEVAS